MDYDEMLKKARKEMPESVRTRERFEVPQIKGHIQGNKTVITNFVQIANKLQRSVEHLQKYVLKELAAPGTLRNNVLTIGSKIPAARINEKIRQYANEFVICGSCGKPDTKLEKEDQLMYLKCTACGNRHKVRSRI